MPTLMIVGLGWDSCDLVHGLWLSTGRMARAAERGRALFAASPQPRWPAIILAVAFGIAVGYAMADGGAAAGGPVGDEEGFITPTGIGASDGEDPEVTVACGVAAGAAGGERGGGAALGDAAPATPPLRPRGPFTDEEWSRRQWLRRKAERDVEHSLQPLRKWLVEEKMMYHEQKAEVERLRSLLQEEVRDHGGTVYRLGVMEKQMESMAADITALKRQRLDDGSVARSSHEGDRSPS